MDKHIINGKKKRVILYMSHGGSTQKYAEWIAEDCDAACINITNSYSIDMISDHDTVIFGSYVKMGKVYMRDFLVDHFADFMYKDLFMFTVGLFPLSSPEGQRSWNDIPAYIRDEILYHEKFSGQIDHGKLALWEKIIVGVGGINVHNKIKRHETARFVSEVCSDQVNIV
jgi:menaquinone-dependent protoporphyrinogen IX oxidase